jgi:hypothetical protein
MSERIIISPSELTEDEVQALEEFLGKKRESIFNRWPEKNLRDIEEFIQDYRNGRDRLEEQFLEENPDMIPDDWRHYLDKPREPQDYQLEELDIAKQNDNSVSAPDPEAPGQPQGRKAKDWEQKGSKTPADPRAAALVQMASAPITDPGRAAALKPVEKLTESEMKEMIDTAQSGFRGWRSGDPLKAHLYEKVQDWHADVYGDGPQRHDGGKPVEPMPIRPIAEQPSPHTTPQGEDLWQATGRIGQKVADAGAVDGFDDAVKGLQRGLNILNQANPLPQRSPAYTPYTKLGPVDEDGKYGPQTDFALKHAAARLGAPKVEEAFALGRFNTFARNAQRNGNPDGLEDKAHSIFGPLFRNPADGKAPKIEGGVLQETLNDIGPRHHDDWEPLKVDDWIGPKTTDAFGKVLKAEDADTITGMFGRGLGLL